MTPTARSLETLRALGYTAQVVERWNPHAKIRQDLFGCIDILAVNGHVLGVQACAGSSAAARATKAVAEPRLRTWLEAGCAFEVWAWRKVGPRGKRKVWAVRRLRARIADGEIAFEELAAVTPQDGRRDAIDGPVRESYCRTTNVDCEPT